MWDDSVATNGPIRGHNTINLGEVTLSSEFDSGNMLRAERTGDDLFWIWTANDAYGTQVQTGLRSWFHFSVKAPKGRNYSFSLRNLNNHLKMYREGMRPVVKIGDGPWARIEGRYTYLCTEHNMELTFTQSFDVDELYYFAFTFPWSYTENGQLLTELQSSIDEESIYFHREILVKSVERRSIELITISSYDKITDQREKTLPNLYPGISQRPFKFRLEKKVVFVSARVHPGEIVASHVMNGILKFLCSDDPRAKLCRKIFVFKIVPIINVDGVYRGFQRCDTNGVNLNRLYLNPNLGDAPQIYAIKELIKDIHKEDRERFYCYLDLHGHATKRGCFFYGNHMDYSKSIDSFLYAKLIALNDPNFDFEGSVFSEKLMRIKDRKGESREGSGRVGIFKAINIARCYTLECNYNTGKVVNAVPPASNMDDPGVTLPEPPPYTKETFHDLGWAMMIALLDSCNQNPYSRLPQSDYKDLMGIRIAIAEYISKLTPFRFDTKIKKAVKDPSAFKEYVQSLMKPSLPEKSQTTGNSRTSAKNSKRQPFSSTSVLNPTPNKLKRLKPELRDSSKKENNKTKEHNKSTGNIKTNIKPTRSSRHSTEGDTSFRGSNTVERERGPIMLKPQPIVIKKDVKELEGRMFEFNIPNESFGVKLPKIPKNTRGPSPLNRINGRKKKFSY